MAAIAESALVTAARGGSSAAYGELFERYHSRIYNYAYGLAGNREDAADVAQEAFARVFEALPRLTGELNFSAYLYRTAHNLAINAVKHRGRLAPPETLDLQLEPSLRADPERVALVQEQQEQAWRSAFELSDTHRSILTLRELHDMSYQEIAEVMDMPRNTVGVLLSRARIKFKEAFRMSSIDTEKLVEECRKMLPLLSAYIDDELEQAKRAQVESHLEDCAFCRLALEEMTEASRSYRVLIPLLPPAEAKAAAWDRLSDSLPAAARSRGGLRPKSKAMPIALGALALVLLAGGLAGWGSTILGTGSPPVATTNPAQPVSASGSLTTQRSGAADAATISLGAGSSTSAFATTTSRAPTTTALAPAASASSTTETPAVAPVRSTTTSAAPLTTMPTTSVAPTTTSTPPPKPVDTQPPPTPRLLAPPNGAVVQGGRVKLQWEAVKDASGVTYQVEIQHSNGKSDYGPTKTLRVSGTTLAHSMSSSLERWRVSAVDGKGNRSSPSKWWTISRAPTVAPTTTTTIILF